MSYTTFETKAIDLRDTWAAASNATPAPSQDDLIDICAQYIEGMEELIKELTGGNPLPPPPRIRH